jgi:hypothetical protein
MLELSPPLPILLLLRVGGLSLLNTCTAFPSTLVSMLELSPPLPILVLLRVGGLSLLNTWAVYRYPLIHKGYSFYENCL